MDLQSDQFHHDPVSQGGHEQLQMFMTPHEVMHKYQPLDADRLDSDEGYASSGTPASALSGSTGNRPQRMRYQQDTKGPYEATPGGTKWRASTESDSDLWERKADESLYDESQHVRRQTRVGTSWYGSDSFVPDTRPSMGSEPLYESIQKHGIREPISLGTTGKYGTSGMRQVVGGHHRLASQFDINPNQPMPVLHFHDIYDAKAGQFKPYT